MANIIIWTCFNEDSNAVRTLGATQISHWLRLHGYTTKVIDFCNGISTDKLVEITEKYIDSDTIAVGCSTTFWLDSLKASHRYFIPGDPKTKLLFDNTNPDAKSYDHYDEPGWAIRARERVESRHPSLKWLLGGPKIDHVGRNARFKWIKFHGYAEDSIVKFLDECSGRNSRPLKFDITKQGSCYYDDMGIQPQEMLTIELGRGCPFKCEFCSYSMIGKKKNTHLRDYKLVEDELRMNYEKFGTTSYYFADHTVNESVEKVEALANIASRLPFKLQWVGYNRLDLIGVHRETIDLLRESGIKGSYFGIETFHPGASAAISKKWNGKHGKDFVLELSEIWGPNISNHLSFIIGLPGEDEASVRETDEWCRKHDIHSWHFAGLYLSRIGESIFDKSPQQYGYKFTDPMSNEKWSSDFFDSDSTVKLAQELNLSWNHRIPMIKFPRTAALGYSMDEIIQTRLSKIMAMVPEMRTKYQEFIDRYVESQLK